ncbi:MAG TPA: DUF3301 domain-containing protein [Rhodanobacteraceae bacterium]|nr:DUF3301 domain-containing protein [Rhodanobacteraceae bacterium]
MSTEVLVLLLMIAVAVAWTQATRMRERALAAAQRLCAAQDVQLLDQSVGLAGLRLRRHGGWALECHYGFEVSLDGKDRHHGRLWLVGGRLAGVSTPWRDSAHVLAFVTPGALPSLPESPRRLH